MDQIMPERGQRRDARGVAVASVADTLAAVAEVVLPTFAKGIILRRPRVEALAERLDLDGRAVRRMGALRDAYGDGPLLLRLPLRRQALLLSAADARRVLEETPDPFSPASREKRAALAHFEPDVSLISEGPARDSRRALNDVALESTRPVHGMAARFLGVVEEEIGRLAREARTLGRLDWAAFLPAWEAAVRRIVLGDSARDDAELTEMLRRLRAAANWAFLRPTKRSLRASFRARVEGHLARAEAGSLAGRLADLPGAKASPADQVAHWLFAFEAAGIATLRALALLAAHPEAAGRAGAELAGCAERPFLRACLRESLRLWPTTPAILRETTAETRWRTGTLPAGTGLVVFAPFFHRDETRLDCAHRFAPELWLEGAPEGVLLVPFSAGPGTCPAHHLVPMLGAAALAALLERGDWALAAPRLDPARLPGTLDHTGLVLVPAG